MARQTLTRSATLLLALLAVAAVLAGWKHSSVQAADAAWASQPEPMEVVTAATARTEQYRPSMTAIGTVRALRSVTLSNEVAGTVASVALEPGEIVEAGTVLVALDVSVEQAALKAQQARARLAETHFARVQSLRENRAVSQEEVDRALAERDVAVAEVERLRAIIERKTIRAPFRATVGIANVHPGQYLAAGTVLTTLQSVEDAVHVDFAVPQQAAAQLEDGDRVGVFAGGGEISATIVAIDSRVDPVTRNATVRARIDDATLAPAPGASVQVKVPVGEPRAVVSLPVKALRKGPAGDHVFVLAADAKGQLRAHRRAVESGPMQGDRVLIVAGLEAGERVAASGSFKLREAVLVAIDEESRVAAATGSL